MKTIWITEQEEIEKIIMQCPVCFVGVADKNGIPYVLPMNFGYENKEIFLHSAQEGFMIDILNQNNQACITFCTDSKLKSQHPDMACSYRMDSKSVICHGKIIFEEDFNEKVKALDSIMRTYSNKKFQYGDPSVRNVKIWRMKIEKISAKAFGQPHK
jgi:nitroimidazol reductase NimA-like FMN-containing flavoprotein (pyridoxamine 5'-phosphate oxidase superfamily)